MNFVAYTNNYDHLTARAGDLETNGSAIDFMMWTEVQGNMVFPYFAVRVHTLLKYLSNILY